MSWSETEGMPHPLGATRVEDGHWNFALYSKHASAVTLLLYGDDVANPLLERALNHIGNKSGRVWHCRITAQELQGIRYYAYCVDGPADSSEPARQRFDRSKIAVDPYARAIHFPPSFSRAAASSPGSNAGRAALGVLLDAPTLPRAPRTPPHEHDLVIYEMHVRGFTQSPTSGVAPARRGTFAGVTDRIDHLRDLGVTAVELMPVHQFDPQARDYWGYMPLFFFAPHTRYCAAAQPAEALAEFKALVDGCHASGIEVILDVVYNHTGEAGLGGPSYSYRLIDNSTYYLSDDASGQYLDFTGTGNSLHCANSAVRRVILDSMRYWVTEMGVDGFRFDLASIFSRNSDGSLNTLDPPIFGQIAADPALADVRLIAEPWDLGVFQLGRGFPGQTWLQWNGHFRDTIQQFVRSDPGQVGKMMSAVYGSSELFPDDVMTAGRPVQSVNYFSSHDGFTLYDLVSYNRKHNEANGEGNRDGPNQPSWNCGWEGDQNVPAEVAALRLRQVRNFLTLLFVSNGTPMLRMGDEFAQTQFGNNNPYNQDNPTSWLDWNRKSEHAELYRFTRELIALRKRHPSLSRSRFWRSDVGWYGVGSSVDLTYEARSLAFCVRGASQEDADIYVIANAYWQELTFAIQEMGPWRRVVDTALPPPDDIQPEATAPLLPQSTYVAAARSVVVLVKS